MNSCDVDYVILMKFIKYVTFPMILGAVLDTDCGVIYQLTQYQQKKQTKQK